MFLKRFVCTLLVIVFAVFFTSCGPSFAYINLQAQPGGIGFPSRMAQSAVVIRQTLESHGIKLSNVVWDEKGLLSVQFGEAEPFPEIGKIVNDLVASSHFLEIKKVDGTLVCTSADFTSVFQDTDGTGAAIVVFDLDGDAAQKYAQATLELAAAGGSLQVYYDGVQIPQPVVTGPVTDGKGVISVSSQEQAADIVQKVQSPPLPLPFRVTVMLRRAISAVALPSRASM